ncbi:MAG: ribonuclease P protein component [Candidatus Paceibacterota bacterium]|jgi:ribonuclease P protein component
MLAKSQRLTTKQFDIVMEKGRVAHSTLFLLRFVSGQVDTRISAVAPKKIAKTAVVRNRNRRRIYAAIRPLMAVIIPGIWGALFIKKDISEIELADIAKDVQELFIKAKISKS